MSNSSYYGDHGERRGRPDCVLSFKTVFILTYYESKIFVQCIIHTGLIWLWDDYSD